jgi:peptidoglycan/xylan/chitin deacetylase (PgdA/CDA1 family)
MSRVAASCHDTVRVLGAEMLVADPGLPDGSLCLTFDDGPGETDGDGPGPRTAALAELLAELEVPTTFFMCGNGIRRHPRSVARVLGLGHGVGNHTDTHPSLTALPDDVVAREVRSAQDALRDAGVTGRIPFRPPYGDWDQRCAAALGEDAALSSGLSGVIGWDVDPQDWASWQSRDAAEVAATRLVDACVRARRGIVLLHDCSADPDPLGSELRAGNRALESARLAIPALRAHGFTFVTLHDALPRLATTQPVRRTRDG